MSLLNPTFLRILIRSLIAALFLAPAVVCAQSNIASGDVVPPVDLGKIKASDFTGDELDLPYYLVNFHVVANSVPLEGNLRGWITSSVWRGNSNQHTYNARVLESQLALAYFYCTERPWNPYYGHPAVRARLEAMLERLCNMQGANGEFSEYAPEQWGLAPTAFATKFMGESLRLLAHGPPMDPLLLDRVKRAERKAIVATLTDPELWRHGREYANQFSNVFAGGLAWLALNPNDDELRSLLLKRMIEAESGLQSPAGYFYERDGSDWGYSLSTHHSNLEIAWNYARGTAFEPIVLNMIRRYYDWLSWNAVIEPDGSGFVLNRAIETRQRRPWLGLQEDPRTRNYSSLPQAEWIPSARVFLPGREQRARAQAQLRAELEKNWPVVPELREGNFSSFTPYAFLHRSVTTWFPTDLQRARALRQLPCLRNGRFTHLRADDRHRVSYLFVRRPNYYAAFNSGEQIAEAQRYGLGLLWAPGLGALAQSQTGSGDNVWGTRQSGAQAPYEAGSLKAKITMNGNEVRPEPGAVNLRRGDLSVSYPLGTAGLKSIRFEDDRILVETRHPGVFVETVPLLAREADRLRIDAHSVVLERGGRIALTIEFDPRATAELLKPAANIGPYQVVTVQMTSTDHLSYAAVITPGKSAANP